MSDFTLANIKKELLNTTTRQWIFIPFRIIIMLPLLILIKMADKILYILNILYDYSDLNIKG